MSDYEAHQVCVLGAGGELVAEQSVPDTRGAPRSRL